MGRKNNGKTEPKQMLLVYRNTLRKLENELVQVCYIIDRLQMGEPLLQAERTYLLDRLYVKLHKLQKRRDWYSETVDRLNQEVRL